MPNARTLQPSPPVERVRERERRGWREGQHLRDRRGQQLGSAKAVWRWEAGEEMQGMARSGAGGAKPLPARTPTRTLPLPTATDLLLTFWRGAGVFLACGEL